MRRLWLVVLVGLVLACGANAADETMTTTDSPITTTTVAPTTTTVVETPTTTAEPPRVEYNEPFGVGGRRSIVEGVTYAMLFDGFTVEITPPMPGWWLLGYGQSSALLGWSGPNGLKNGTLEMVIYDVSTDGVEATFSRIEALEERFYRDLEWEWTWADQGTAQVGDQVVQWREVRFPPIPPDDPDPDDPNLLPVIDSPYVAVLGHDSSARFYVVPVADLTVTVLAWEARCKCPESVFDREDFTDQDVENELSMWIDELEAFLAHVEFVEQ